MYKEVTIVLNELIKKLSSQYPMLNKFTLYVVLSNPENVVNKMNFTETALNDLLHFILQVNNFSDYTR